MQGTQLVMFMVVFTSNTICVNLSVLTDFFVILFAFKRLIFMKSTFYSMVTSTTELTLLS